nr:immunoglobulin light chain junction region [Macaca mulatta]MOX26812.1 immunoglobulin light chain junction region [Macaca mulatta]MOX97476.1 immunoglobulin light chain junction region [Macaca mulatta]
CMQALEFPWMF